MAFPTLETAALSGATVRQLSYWRRKRGSQPALLVPEYRDGRTYLYSYRDVVALRMFVYLRERISLQKIRRAVDQLDNLSDPKHLSAYKLIAVGNSIVWIEPNSDPDEPGRYIDLVRRPGQTVITAAMEAVLGSFKTESRKVLPFPRPRQRVSRRDKELLPFCGRGGCARCRALCGLCG
jgi:DNA-binding transcriptional MerR regulator